MIIRSRPSAAARVSLRRSEFGAVFALPCREVASSVKKCPNNYAAVVNPIQQPVVEHE